MVVAVGDPGIGKSTVFDYTRKAMELCGFSAPAAKDISSQFNKRESFRANLAIYDDLRQEKLKAILESDDFKSAISGGKITTEEKRENAVETIPRAVFIGNLNNFTPQNLYSIDNGAKNRFCTISAYTAEGGESENPWNRTARISKELGVPREAIWVRVLRDCLDYTIDFCMVNGDKPANGRLVNKEINQKSLENKMYFDSEPGITFLSLCLTGYAIAYNKAEKAVEGVQKDIRDSTLFFEGIRSLYYYLVDKRGTEEGEEFVTLINDHWETTTKDFSKHPRMGLRELRWVNLEKPMSMISCLMADKSFNPHNISDQHIQEVIIECENNNGKIRKAYSTISSDWSSIGNNRTYLRLIESVSDYVISHRKHKPTYNSSGILALKPI